MVDNINIQDEVLAWDLDTLSSAIRNKEISPVEVTERVLKKIHLLNKELNAYITVLDDQAIAAAEQAENKIMRGEIKGPLHGVPIGLKDFIFMKDIKTTMGSSIYKDYYPSYDASVVTRLQQAGAIIIGKQNTHEFAYGTTGDESYYGAVKNPYDMTKVTGGSSSGSAAATAAHMCFGSLGTDTGGSVRGPSSFCGIVGMKPTYGRVSKWGVYPLCESLDHVGTMTRTVKDNAILLNVLSGYDPNDSHTVKREIEDFTDEIDAGVKGLTIGIPTSFYFEDIDDQIRENVEQTIQVYKGLGAEIRYIDIEGMKKVLQAFLTILRSEAYATHELNINKYADSWNTEAKERLMNGRTIKANEYIKAFKIKAQALAQFKQIFEEVDAILTPVTRIMQPDLYEREVNLNGNNLEVLSILNNLTGPSNLLGLPSLSVPIKVPETTHPIGFQLIGDLFEEQKLYRLANAYEREFNWTD